MKKLFVCFSLMCIGLVFDSFAGSCTVSNHGKKSDDCIRFGTSGSIGLFCNVMGDKTCDYGHVVMINGVHSLGKNSGSSAIKGFHIYKCGKDRLTGYDRWIYEDEPYSSIRIRQCISPADDDYEVVAVEESTIYKAKTVNPHKSGNVKYAAGNPEEMCWERKKSQNQNSQSSTTPDKQQQDAPTNNKEQTKPQQKEPTTEQQPVRKTVEQQCQEYNGGQPCSEERLACFKMGSATTWESGKCKCKDKNKEWKNGQCIQKQTQNVSKKSSDITPVKRNASTTTEQQSVKKTVKKASDNGCKLEFSDGTVLDDIDNANWDLDSGNAYIQKTNDNYADDKPLKKLTKINGKTVNLVIPDANKVYSVHFRCKPWNNGEHFAFDCKYGYDKAGQQIGMDGIRAVYDKCEIPDGGCKLEFSDGTVLDDIDNANWNLDSGSAYIKKTNDNYAEEKPLTELTKINGKTVNLVIPDANKVYSVHFRCKPWNNGEHFAFDCKYGYDKAGQQIGTDGTRAVYDKCIEVSEDSEFGDGYYDDTNNDAEIDAAKLVLKKFFKDANDRKSVWKNAEGKFNTARLASDVTAGVVLGTVGGVVSGVVIKKKQVDKGFDALHCAVGGQTVADWGDLFRVGITK